MSKTSKCSFTSLIKRISFLIPRASCPTIYKTDWPDMTERRSENYRGMRPDISRLRDLAVACMNPTPNDLTKDKESFIAAEGIAMKSVMVADLRTGQADKNRFQPITQYVMDLRTKLGNFHCDVPNH